MSPGSGSELSRSDYLQSQHHGDEAGSRARYAYSGAEHCRSGSQYVNTSSSVEVRELKLGRQVENPTLRMSGKGAERSRGEKHLGEEWRKEYTEGWIFPWDLPGHPAN